MIQMFMTSLPQMLFRPRALRFQFQILVPLVPKDQILETLCHHLMFPITGSQSLPLAPKDQTVEPFPSLIFPLTHPIFIVIYRNPLEPKFITCESMSHQRVLPLAHEDHAPTTGSYRISSQPVILVPCLRLESGTA